jgi:hypothetical protein
LLQNFNKFSKFSQAITNCLKACNLLNKFHDLREKGLSNAIQMRQLLALGFTAEDLLANNSEEQQANVQQRGQVGG